MRLAVLLLACVAVCRGQGTTARLFPCNASSPTQLWQPGPTGNEIVQVNGGACLDVENYGTNPGSVVWAYYPCHPDDKDPTHQNEAWSFTAEGTIKEISTGLCLDTANSQAYAQAAVQLATCTSASTQKWTWDNATKLISNGAQGFCLDVGTTIFKRVNPCTVEPASSMPFCDTSLSVQDRVANLVANLTTDEKLALFANGAGAIPRLNIPAYQWWSEALHGVGGSPGVSWGGVLHNATSFPQVITTGSSFNTTLFHALGVAIGTEGRAFNNVGQAGLTFWTPNVNIIRDPRWGRGQETPGEDPFLTSEYAANFVPGLQGDDPKYLLISSCCKHYHAYDLENWGGVQRYSFNAIVTPQDDTETYLPTFQSCVQRGNASSLMCSYNAVNGVPSCADKNLMTTLARDTWGFQGYITSDCGAVAGVYEAHHYTNTTDETCAVTLGAGMDIDCGGFLDKYMGAAINNSVLSLDSVDTALQHLFAVQMRLGMFDPASAQPYTNIPPSAVNSAAHQQLALDAARQGIVLLKNDKNTLPLSASAVKTVAVIGPNANATKTLQGNYYGTAPFLITALDGIATYTSAVYASGCADVACNSSAGFDAAVALAKSADAVVLVVGIDETQEREGQDRTNITLPGFQNELIAAVAASASGPVIVVLMAGGPTDISLPKSLPTTPSILFVGYPGQAGGQAIADVIFGTYPPAGRLPYTIYPAQFTNQVSMFDMQMRPNASTGNPGHTYKFYTGTPVYEFGTGLSYSQFTVTFSGPTSIPLAAVERALGMENEVPFHLQEPLATITATVTNVGTVASDYVVLLFVNGTNPVKPDGSGTDPIKSLQGFARVNLGPGQQTTVPFPVSAPAVSRVDANGKRVVTPDLWRFAFEGASLTVKVE